LKFLFERKIYNSLLIFSYCNTIFCFLYFFQSSITPSCYWNRSKNFNFFNWFLWNWFRFLCYFGLYFLFFFLLSWFLFMLSMMIFIFRFVVFNFWFVVLESSNKFSIWIIMMSVVVMLVVMCSICFMLYLSCFMFYLSCFMLYFFFNFFFYMCLFNWLLWCFFFLIVCKRFSRSWLCTSSRRLCFLNDHWRSNNFSIFCLGYRLSRVFFIFLIFSSSCFFC